MVGHDFTLGDWDECADCREDRRQAEEHQAEEARQEEIAAVREDFRRRAGLPGHFWTQTFDSWLLEKGWKETRVFQAVRRWARNMPDPPVGYPSLVLHSPKPGPGKTTLAACVINHLIGEWPVDPRQPVLPVRYETGPDLNQRVRATYNIRDGDVEWRETEWEVYNSLRGVKLLVLDDVGDPRKEPRSDHTQRVYFHLIDLRYRDDLPILLCTNSDGPELEALIGPYAYDRIVEMAGRVIKVSGHSRAQRRKG